MMRSRRVVVVGAAVAALLLAAAVSTAATRLTPGPAPDGSGVTTVGWRVHPAGRQVTVGGRPLGLGLSPDGGMLLVSDGGQSTQTLSVVDPAGGVRQRFTGPTESFSRRTGSPPGSPTGAVTA